MQKNSINIIPFMMIRSHTCTSTRQLIEESNTLTVLPIPFVDFQILYYNIYNQIKNVLN